MVRPIMARPEPCTYESACIAAAGSVNHSRRRCPYRTLDRDNTDYCREAGPPVTAVGQHGFTWTIAAATLPAIRASWNLMIRLRRAYERYNAFASPRPA